MLDILPFLTKFHENIQKVGNRLNKYLKDPKAKNIHDIRTSIRRLNAAFSTLPKKYRTGSSMSTYILSCKELFKINSEIRDLDIIYEKLQKYPPTDDRNKIIDSLKETRMRRLEDAKNVALVLKNTDASKLLDEIKVTQKELDKRYSKILANLISKIETNFPIVITDSTKIEELHDLRKACKKLRYMLELLPVENKKALETRKILQKIQDILGTIHDYDFTINHLELEGQPSNEIREIINNEMQERKLNYERFIRFCLRRLRMSPNSFLIRIRNFKLSLERERAYSGFSSL
ncbi:MAG: CHAD domain-containing protein [Nitrososphaerota archaeon]